MKMEINVNGKITKPKISQRVISLFTVDELNQRDNFYTVELTKSEMKKVVSLLDSFCCNDIPKILTK